jgi:hypothetical protein
MSWNVATWYISAKVQGVVSRPDNLNLTGCNKFTPLQSSRSSLIFSKTYHLTKQLYIKYKTALAESYVQIPKSGMKTFKISKGKFDNFRIYPCLPQITRPLIQSYRSYQMRDAVKSYLPWLCMPWTWKLLARPYDKTRRTTTQRGHAVEQLVGALRYKSERRGFDLRWCHWNFSLT